MKKLRFTRRARANLVSIENYIAKRDNSINAARWIDRFLAECKIVAQYPEIAIARNDLRYGLKMRVCGRYLIFFEETETTVDIALITQGMRDLQKIFE